ncbi:putative baseplate assembly protein [Actinophytocola sp.]|uniref:putative baseplate assembly protein n=1 Tax=Actinophytocola sp. TaxID=1872138 RepID=UPI003D6BA467
MAGTDGRLPVPSLDDRRYADLVEAALRLRDRYCPEWTSTEPGDPGIALIEVFAYLVDQLLYRLNQVPDRLYSEFLNMVGVNRRTATVAEARVDFMLDAPGQTVRIPAGTPVSTVAGEGGPVEFLTVEQATARPISLRWVVDSVNAADETESGRARSTVPARQTEGSWVELVLGEGGPNSLVRVELDVLLGTEPAGAQLEWQCSGPGGWIDVEAESVPADRPAVLVDTGPDWVADSDRHKLRVRPVLDTPVKKDTEITVHVHDALGAGVSVDVQHASAVPGEALGIGTGRPRQRLRTRRAPMLPELHRIRVGGTEWTAVTSLVDSNADDRHYELDCDTGEVLFGDGTHGAIPAEDAEITIDYLAGGGVGGNVAAGTIVVLREAIQHVARVHNRWPATGGMAAEPVEEARSRAPALLRSGWRAVSADDFERLARLASPRVARVRCLAEPGVARVVVVPHAEGPPDAESFASILPGDPVFDEVVDFLDERRAVGVRLVVEPPDYQGVRVVAEVTRSADEPAEEVYARAAAALRDYLHPVRGGRDGQGWTFGRPVVAGELFGVLLDVPGVELVDEVRLYAWDPVTDQTGERTDRIDLKPNGLCWPAPPVVRAR